MKKLIIILSIALVLGVSYWGFSQRHEGGVLEPIKNVAKQVNPGSQSAPSQAQSGSYLPADSSNPIQQSFGDPHNARTEEGFVDEDTTPATKKYKSADEAIAAVKAAAESYDDTVLQRFVQPAEDCSWCSSFYSSMQELIKNPTEGDKRSFYAELLAISGRLENIQFLTENLKNSSSQTDKEMLAEALELTLGGDDTVRYLSAHLDSADELLKEASVAAISNQGTKLSVEMLYKNAVDSKNPDGYYSIGTGLGELVPDPEAFNFLQEAVLKRDEYSHLASKALLNAGLPGIKLVFDALQHSQDSAFDAKVLDGGVDHLAYDEETKDYLTKVVANPSTPPAVLEFSKAVLSSFAEEEASEMDDLNESDE